MIRPVDMQAAVQRSPEVQRSQNLESQRPEVQNQQFATRLQREAEQRENQVLESNKSEQEAIKRDGKGKGQQPPPRRSRKPEEKTKSKAFETDGESMFDIRI